MWDNIWLYLSLFKHMILVTLVVSLGLMAGVLWVTRRFSWNTGVRGLYGYLIHRSNRELVFLSAACLQMTFILSAVLFGTTMELAHLILLAGLALAKLLSDRRVRVLGRDLVNSGLIFAALMVENILLGYLKETRFNLFVVVIMVLLGVLLLLYGGYFFLKDVEEHDRT
ncbi:MAG: hypothetical protein ACLTKI_00210 [Lachnospiraceae bacterium]